MAAPPPLFDPNLRQLRLARADRNGRANFLHEEARNIIEERLEEVNRPFPDRCIVTDNPSVWQKGRHPKNVVDFADVLEIEPGSLDLVVHAMCLHSANDPVGQMVQCRRALRPDGMFLAVMFGGQTLSELRSCLAQAEVSVMDGISPRVHPMAEIRDLGALLQRAGFALPVADSFTMNVHYSSMLHLTRDLRDMGETNVLSQQNRGFLRRDVLAAASELYELEFAASGDRINATYEFVFLTGWAPSADQPKPLRPGSASARLADALGVPEQSTGDAVGHAKD